MSSTIIIHRLLQFYYCRLTRKYVIKLSLKYHHILYAPVLMSENSMLCAL